ncbi:MAG: lysylphosphatidylglycerol synthase transmembrane domain-containing protein [Acidobacteriota bacterium]
MAKRSLRLWLGIFLGGFLLYLFLRGANFTLVINKIRGANYLLIGFSLGLALLVYLVRAYRWKFLLMPLKETRLTNLFSTTIIGYMVNSLIPGRLGEIVRPYLLGQKEGLSKTAAFATIIVERIFDLITLLALFSLYLMLAPSLPYLSSEESAIMSRVEWTGVISAIAGAALIALLLLWHLKIHLFIKVAEKLSSFLPARFSQGLSRGISSFAQGLTVLRGKGLLLKIGFYSLVHWLMVSFSLWLILLAFKINIPFYFTFLILLFAATGAAIPTPAGVGAYHKAVQIVLVSFLAIENNLAVGASIVMHAVSFAPATLLGIVLVWKEGLNIRKISRS